MSRNPSCRQAHALHQHNDDPDSALSDDEDWADDHGNTPEDSHPVNAHEEVPGDDTSMTRQGSPDNMSGQVSGSSQDNSSTTRPTASLGRATDFARHVRIEEVPDEDYCSAGRSTHRHFTPFEQVYEDQIDNNQGQYGPLTDEELWETSQFLLECCGKGETDRFVKLGRVSESCHIV